MINTEIWEPVPEKPGYVQYVGQRKTEDVFRELQEFLQKENLMPDEYFQMDYGFKKSYPLFPKTDDFRCYAQWGGSEGIYLEVELLARSGAAGKMEVIPFATGKSLDESPDAYDRMQYIAGRIYRVLTSDDYVPEQKQRTDETVKKDGTEDRPADEGSSFDINEYDDPDYYEQQQLAEQEAREHPRAFDYMLLDRLRCDCEYFLGAGNRQEKHLWAGSVEAQIAKMREIYDSFSPKDRPEWLSAEDIDVYERKMLSPSDFRSAEREQPYAGVPDGIRAHFEGRDVYAAYGDVQYPQHVHMIERLSDGRYQALYNHEIVLEAGKKIGGSHTDGGIYATFDAAKKDLEKFCPTARLVYDRSAAVGAQTEDFSAPKRNGRSI